MGTSIITQNNDHYYRTAFALAVFTILYNVLEGLISTYFGIQDESLALFGFGADSFIEVISGLGIAHMVLRIRKIRAVPGTNLNVQPCESRALPFTPW